MDFLFQNVTASWMLDWAESVPQNQVSLKENLGVILTFFTRPVKTWTALSSPRYRWPQCVPLSSLHTQSQRLVKAPFWRMQLQVARP